MGRSQAVPNYTVGGSRQEMSLQTQSQVKGEAEAGDREVASQSHRGRNKPGSEAKEHELHPLRSVFQPRSHASESPGATARPIPGVAQAQNWISGHGTPCVHGRPPVITIPSKFQKKLAVSDRVPFGTF